MKFISFNHDNSEKFGIIENNLITDLTGKIDGASSLKDMGKIMGSLKQNYSDSIDFSKVNIIVKGLLN